MLCDDLLNLIDTCTVDQNYMEKICRQGNYTRFSMLIDTKIWEYISLFHEACKGDSIEIVNYLLTHRLKYCDIERGIEQACITGFLPIIKLLVQREGVNGLRFSTYHLVINEHYEAIKYLFSIEKIKKCAVMFIACSSGKMNMVKYMSHYVEDIDEANLQKCLSILCEKGDLIILKYFLKVLYIVPSYKTIELIGKRGKFNTIKFISESFYIYNPILAYNICASGNADNDYRLLDIFEKGGREVYVNIINGSIQYGDITFFREMVEILDIRQVLSYIYPSYISCYCDSPIGMYIMDNYQS